MCSSDIFLGILAILFPPIAVWIKSGICTADSLINILLCTLGYIPGLLHAWYIISLYPEVSEQEYAALDAETGQAIDSRGVTYYYVEHRSGGEQQLNAGPRQEQQQGYGTLSQPQLGQEGPSQGVPPSYEQAIKGDHKVQRQ